jgi:diguanylate cyclase (GGDEF)-like protein
MLDLDFFKQVNDQFGHAEGDRVLKAVADVLRATCRQNDVAARYGGEEFAIALPDTRERGALIVAETFRAAIASISGMLSSVSASIGVVTFTPSASLPPADTLFARLINDADRALYAAKHAGRNRVCHASSLVIG